MALSEIMFDTIFFFIVDYIFSFAIWLESFTIWKLITIVAFTVAMDISRNIGKCIILIIDEIKKRYRPRHLNLLRKPKISILIPAHNESSAIKKQSCQF